MGILGHRMSRDSVLRDDHESWDDGEHDSGCRKEKMLSTWRLKVMTGHPWNEQTCLHHPNDRQSSSSWTHPRVARFQRTIAPTWVLRHWHWGAWVALQELLDHLRGQMFQMWHLIGNQVFRSLHSWVGEPSSWEADNLDCLTCVRVFWRLFLKEKLDSLA